MSDTPTLREQAIEQMARAMVNGAGNDADAVTSNGVPGVYRPAWMHKKFRAQDALDALLEFLPTAGLRVVPVKATEEMSDAGWIDKEDVDPNDIYSSMIAVAPDLLGEGE